MSYKIGIICSEFNKDIVEKLYQEATKELSSFGVEPLVKEWVPGAGEITLASEWLMKKHKLDGLLALGVVIKGETDHYSFLKRTLETGLVHLQTLFSCPIIFSVLLVETRKQAEERVGGKKERGKEAAQALWKMLELKKEIFN